MIETELQTADILITLQISGMFLLHSNYCENNQATAPASVCHYDYSAKLFGSFHQRHHRRVVGFILSIRG